MRKLCILSVAAGCALMSACMAAVYGPPEGTVFGVAGCGGDEDGLCKQLAGNTIQSWGPWRYDYLAPDGTAHHWQGDHLLRGKWYMSGRALCIAIYPNVSPRCAVRSQIVGDIDAVLAGDPFQLAQSAPGKLSYKADGSIDNLLKERGIDPSTVSVTKGLPG